MTISFLANQDPFTALYHHFNVAHSPHGPTLGQPLPDTIDLPVLRDAHMPTHLLAISESDPTDAPLLAPIHADLYNHHFRIPVLPQVPPGTASPVPHPVPTPPHPTPLEVTLPVVPLSVPHSASAPLLLLFALRLETHTNLLAARLLPTHAIGEFPNAAAMAQVMARMCSAQTLDRYVTWNHGMWMNVLALGPRDKELIRLVQTAWGVTAEARRIRSKTDAPV